MKTMIFTIALIAVAASLSACETVKGVGRDITHGSETVQSWF